MTPPERLQDVTLAERLLGEIRGAVARGWCSPENQHKEMDVTLALAIADEVARLWQVEAAAALSVRGWPKGMLNRKATLELLSSHNAWRRGAEGPQTDPRMLGLALDAAVAYIATPPSEG